MKKSIILFLLAINSVLFAHEWNPYEINTDKNLNDVFFLSENLGWIVGDDGVIFKFENEQWVQIEQDITSENLNSVFFVNDSIGWVVGNNGVILKYDNEQFTLFDSPTDQHLNGVCFVGENFGWIAGSNRTLLEFNNEGWDKYPTDQFSGALGDLQQIQFLDSTFGAMMGGGPESGECLLTYSNNQWVEVSIPVNTTYLNGLFVLSPDTIYTTRNQNAYGSQTYFTRFNSLTGGESGVSENYSNRSNIDIDIANKIGWSVFDNTLLLYEDGLFKSYFQEPLSSNHLNAIELVNDSSGWVVGNSGTLLKYEFKGLLIKATNTPFAQDNGNTNTSEDIKVTVATDNTDYISEFRTFVIPYSDTANIDATYASSLPSNYYTSFSFDNLDSISINLNKDQLDYYGNPITNDVIYSVQILSVPDSVNSFKPVFSKPSRIFKLESTNSFYAGQKEGFGVHWYDCDSLFCSSSYIFDPTGDTYQSNEIDLNRDGIMDFNVYGYRYFHAGGRWSYEYLFTGLNENLVMTTYVENKEDWLDILYNGYPINDLYPWYHEDGLLYYSDGYSSTGFYPGDRIYYLAFSIAKDGVTQYAWLRLKGTEYIEYGYFDNHTGLLENENKSNFNIYPNPTSDNIHIQATNNIDLFQKSYVSVYNMIGIQVDEFVLSSSFTQRDISKYESGIYLFVIKSNGEITSQQKIMVH